MLLTVRVSFQALPLNWVRIDLTDGLYGHINPRTHDLVPPINLPDQPSRIAPATRAAERMRERRIRRKVRFDSFFLYRRRRLREEVDYTGDLLDCLCC